MGERCNGHCCRAFPLSNNLAEIQASARAELAGEYFWVDEFMECRSLLEDAAVVVDMVIPIGKHRISPSSGNDMGREIDFYTCWHLSPNGDCRIYERRPRVCSEYPYGNDRCDQPACEWDAGKAGGRRSAKLKLIEVPDLAMEGTRS
jgi:Fe-S-cluster containining protein